MNPEKVKYLKTKKEMANLLNAGLIEETDSVNPIERIKHGGFACIDGT